MTHTNPTYPTNPTNIFNFIPHDVTQHVLNPFLEPEDRANFNAVLEPTERVFKRLPPNFAEKHAIRIAYAAQKRHADRINFWTDRASNIPDDSWKKYAAHGVNAVGKYADFFTKPVAAALFKYRTEMNHADRVTTELMDHYSEESFYTIFMSDAIRTKIAYAINAINAIVPEKHVHLALAHSVGTKVKN